MVHGCSDGYVVFAGGMPRASYGDRHTVSVIHGDSSHVVFDLTSPVVDFILLCSADEHESTDVSGMLLLLLSAPCQVFPSNSIWPYPSSDLVRSEREYC